MKEQTIELVLGDITTIRVDCIVNAAHEALMGGGGVDGAIHRAAGQELLSSCREIPQVESGVRCRVGEAHITPGFNLPSKFVIHTVAPKWLGGIIRRKDEDSKEKIIYKSSKEGVDEELKECYKNSLLLAEKNNIKSIAFPSLGTGGHAYPIELASKIAYDAINEVLPLTNIETVYIVCFSEKDKDEYLKLF